MACKTPPNAGHQVRVSAYLSEDGSSIGPCRGMEDRRRFNVLTPFDLLKDRPTAIAGSLEAEMQLLCTAVADPAEWQGYGGTQKHFSVCA